MRAEGGPLRRLTTESTVTLGDIAYLSIDRMTIAEQRKGINQIITSSVTSWQANFEYRPLLE